MISSKGRWEEVECESMVGTDEVHICLLCSNVSNLFCVCVPHCISRKLLDLVPNCVLNILLVVRGEMRR